jgi:uncharacterized protein
MICPADGAVLVMADKSGVEIDYCPTCRGVWLDRGELDKIVARAQAEAGPPMQLAEPPVSRAGQDRLDDGQGNRRDDRPRYRDDDDDDRHRPHKRRESFLSDLFDF